MKRCTQSGEGSKAVSPRLRATLIRILNGSLAAFKTAIIAKQNKWLQQLAKDLGADNLSCAHQDTSSLP